MFINQAIALARKSNKCITREAWEPVKRACYSAGIQILPTDTPDCCVIYSEACKTIARAWNPRAEDLLADDWLVVDALY